MAINPTVIFVSEDKFMHSSFPGGVQLCTQEYMDLFKAGGFKVTPFSITHTRNLVTRIKIKLGVELYQRYDFDRFAPSLVENVVSQEATVVALNQVDLIPFAPLLRNRLGKQIKIIVLSHGNESGDFLHSIVRKPSGRLAQIRDITRLGFSIYQEAYAFSHYVDAVLCISRTESEINHWLGANRTFFVPRTFAPRYLDWQPNKDRIGFVGTLDHHPNVGGLTMLLEELVKLNLGNLKIRIVGAPDDVGKELQRKFAFVEYLGRLDDAALRKEASSWALFVNPIFWYARGASTKLAQAINWGIPIMSTPAGNRGYEWKNGNVLETADAADMAVKIIEAVQSEDSLKVNAFQVRQVAESGPTLPEIAQLLKPWLMN